MTKSLGIAAALSLFSLSAVAQSSVSIYGVADLGLTYGDGSLGSVRQLSQGNLMASRIGFRGTEDLGGGLRAVFTLESGVNFDSGTGQASNSNNQPSGAGTGTGLSFNRLSYLGLAGGWGQVRAGRDWTPSYTQYLRYDIGNGGGLGASQATISSIVAARPTGMRASNAFEYLSNSMGGFTVHAMHALGENASNAGVTKADGRYTGVRGAYAGGGLDAGLAYAVHKVAALGDIKETILGATYDIAGVRVNGMYTLNKTGLANDMHGWQLGVSKAFGATELRASMSTAHTENAAGNTIGHARKVAFMAVHSLSKRTAVYGILAQTRNSDGSAALPMNGVALNGANGTAKGVSVGVRHSF